MLHTTICFALNQNLGMSRLDNKYIVFSTFYSIYTLWDKQLKESFEWRKQFVVNN